MSFGTPLLSCRWSVALWRMNLMRMGLWWEPTPLNLGSEPTLWGLRCKLTPWNLRWEPALTWCRWWPLTWTWCLLMRSLWSRHLCTHGTFLSTFRVGTIAPWQLTSMVVGLTVVVTMVDSCEDGWWLLVINGCWWLTSSWHLRLECPSAVWRACLCGCIWGLFQFSSMWIQSQFFTGVGSHWNSSHIHGLEFIEHTLKQFRIYWINSHRRMRPLRLLLKLLTWLTPLMLDHQRDRQQRALPVEGSARSGRLTRRWLELLWEHRPSDVWQCMLRQPLNFRFWSWDVEEPHLKICGLFSNKMLGSMEDSFPF